MGISHKKDTAKRLPRIGNSAKSVRKYLAAVARSVEAGELTPNQAKEITSAAKGILHAVEVERKRAEIDELRDLVLRAEALQRAGEAHEVESRERMDEADADVR